jgi:hypothetical protein
MAQTVQSQHPWMLLGVKENGGYGREYLLVRCPAEHAALKEFVEHNRCRRIITLYLLNYTRVKVDEHGSYIRSSVPLTSVEPGLTEVGQR